MTATCRHCHQPILFPAWTSIWFHPGNGGHVLCDPLLSELPPGAVAEPVEGRA